MGLVAPGTNAVVQQLQANLQKTTPYQLELYLENLETTLFTDVTAQEELRNWYGHKYRDRQIDVIVVIGPEPLRFLLEARSQFFKGVPVVFCGSFATQVDTSRMDADFTGSWIQPDVPKTVDAALRLLPHTKRLVVVGGSSLYDKGVEQEVEKELSLYRATLDIQFLTALSMNETLEQVKKLPADSIVLFTSFWQDGVGHRYSNAGVALPMVAETSSAPVFGIADSYIGRGVVGGYSVQFADQGKIAAEFVGKILEGKKPSEIPPVTAPSKYMFDWSVLRRWHLRESDLPQGSIVFNRQLSLIEQYKWQVAGIILLITSLAVFSGYLLWHIRMRKQAEFELLQLTGRLIDAQEDERRRIARDIHDDINQRLAMLAVGLEGASQQLDVGSEEVRSKLDSLWEAASQLGIDLHNLSHNLHSSTLDNLGLVAGVSGLCREFSEHTGVTVVFQGPDIPPLSPQLSLCLFRVVQEALQNVKKHSGSDKATVNLEINSDVLHLTISDDGKGLAAAKGAVKHPGLGIQSMRERLRLIGGTLKLQSEIGHGTVVDVRVPYQQTGNAFT